MSTPSMSESSLSFLVNGKRVYAKNPDPKTLLGDFLREAMGLKGLQMPCKQGGCGACTVLISFDADADASVRSCSVDGMHLTTIEGVGSLNIGLSSVQQAIVDHNGIQCGFCTPGMIMSMHGLMFDKSQPTAEEIEDQIDDVQDIGLYSMLSILPPVLGANLYATRTKQTHVGAMPWILKTSLRLVISEEDVVWVLNLL